MASKLTQLVAVAALAGGIVIAAGKPPSTPPPAAEVVKPAQAAEASKAAPRPLRFTAHRKTHHASPPVARKGKQWAALPTVRPIAPIMKEEKRAKAKAKAKQQPLRTAAMPSCASVREQYKQMTWAQKMARYQNSTAAEVAYGRSCLGL